MSKGVTNFGMTSGGSVPPGICARIRGQWPNFDVRYTPAPPVASFRNRRLVATASPSHDYRRTIGGRFRQHQLCQDRSACWFKRVSLDVRRTSLRKTKVGRKGSKVIIRDQES